MRTKEDNDIHFIGCGILNKEIEYILKKNKLSVNIRFLNSSLHNNFDKLYMGLETELKNCEVKKSVVFYGCCHPLIDKLLVGYSAKRTVGQNCISMLIGEDYFESEEKKGAYFLVEDWANNWEMLLYEEFGKNIEIIREIFRESRKYILAINTPFSSNYAFRAEKFSEAVELPLVWIDTNLEHLENCLLDAFKNVMEQNNG